MSQAYSFGESNHGLQIGNNYGSIHYNKSSTQHDGLDTLPVATEAPFNAYQRQHDRTCLRDTRVDLLREIHEWADSDESPGIFWLSGLAGTGKSTIAKTVAADYHAKGKLAASFFFSRANGDVSHAEKFFTSIASQLATTIPALKSKINDAVVRRKDIASQSLDDQWHELIIGPLSTIKDEERKSGYILIVDALDECDDTKNIQVILKCLAEVQSLQNPQLRVLLTSRPEADIQYGFAQVGSTDHQNVVLHDIEPAIVRHDISLFLTHQLDSIRQKFGLQVGWADSAAVATLVQNSGGIFIWAATACRFVEEDGRLAETRLQLLLDQEGSDKLPPVRKLDEIYTTVLASSIRGDYNATDLLYLRTLFREVVGTIVLLQGPLSTADLAELLNKDLATIRRTLEKLNSVLEVPKDDSKAIRLLHPSFRDFVLDVTRCTDPHYYVDQQLAHQDMYRNCLKVMSNHLRHDICNLQDPAACTIDIGETEVSSHIQLSVQYACRFWVYHYTRSRERDDSYTIVDEFLRNHFIHWLEVLALLRRASEATDIVHALDSVISMRHEVALSQAAIDQAERHPLRPRLHEKLKERFGLSVDRGTDGMSLTARSKLQPLVHDAMRFVQAFLPVLEEAPLQLYYAGPVFSPNTSIIKQTFPSKPPAWLLFMPKVSESWDPCLQTLRGYSKSSWWCHVAFSPDGKILASGIGDNRIKLWDAGSGKPLKTLTGHSDYVDTIAYSPNGKILASGSYDCTIQLWDTYSGKPLLKLNDHTKRITSIAFWPDSKKLASASLDGTVKLWDATSGEVLQTLHFSDWIKAIAISPDGNTLVSGSCEAKIQLWDTRSGHALQALKVHRAAVPSNIFNSPSVNSIAFSWDGKMLASGSSDGSVQLWNTVSWSVLRTLRTNFDEVHAIAFSPDCKTLAFGTDDALKLMDADSGKVVQKLKGHWASSVQSVAFSPDGQTIASGSSDEVKIWYTHSGTRSQSSKAHSDTVHAMAFSPDGNMLATGSDDHSVKLWDAGSGKVLYTLNGHSSLVYSVAFSPDSKTLASGSTDERVQLWDTGSGKVRRTLQGYTSVAVAFSPDNKTLASAELTGNIELWDVDSERVIQTLELTADHGLFHAVVFSPDGKILMGSDESMVKLWDVGTGNVLQTLQSKSIAGVAFSPDSKKLALGSCAEGLRVGAYDGTVTLWDAESGKKLHTLDVPRGYCFSDLSSVLWTSAGDHFTGVVPHAALLPRSAATPFISVEEQWIVRDGKRLLWIPSEYRPDIVATHINAVGFGYESGEVMLLSFVP